MKPTPSTNITRETQCFALMFPPPPVANPKSGGRLDPPLRHVNAAVDGTSPNTIQTRGTYTRDCVSGGVAQWGQGTAADAVEDEIADVLDVAHLVQHGRHQVARGGPEAEGAARGEGAGLGG